MASATDAYHSKALEIAQQLESSHTLLVTTRAVVLEVGNALSRRGYRAAAVDLLESIDNDPRIQVVPISEDLYQEAFALFKNRSDKDWGLTDCLSFVVMERRKLTDALTADHHFRQAGFRPLLLEST